MKHFFTLFLFSLLMLLGCVTAQAQFASWEDFIGQRMMQEETDDEAFWDNFIDEMTSLHEHPLAINIATKEDLEQLPFLSPKQIEEILFHIDYYGPLHTVGELMLIPTLDYDTRQLLSFVVSFRTDVIPTSSPTLREMLTKGKSQLMTRLDLPLYTRAGYEPFTRSEWEEHPSQHYWGNKLYHSLRYNYQYNERFYWGFAAEKDAGEPFFTRGIDGQLLGPAGYDYYSGYIQVKDLGVVHDLIIGNYRLSFGQGLIMNTNFSLGKNVALSNLERSATADPIKRHGGTNESDFLRGAAATFRWGATDVTVFGSWRRYDTTLAGDSIQTFLTTGKHRTSVEIDKKGNAHAALAGAHVRYSWNGLHVGATGLWQHYDHPVTNGTQAYRTFYPQGSTFTNVGADWAFFRRYFSFQGEAAFSGNGGWALLNTLRGEPFEKVYLTLLHRHYARDYWGLQARAFSEGSEIRNEQGLYLGIDVQRLRHWRFTTYADLFRFPEERYRVAAPSQGIDVTASATWTPNTRWQLLARYRYKNKERNATAASGMSGLIHEATQRARLQADVTLSPSWTMQTTADYCFVRAEQPDQGVRLSERLSFVPTDATLFDGRCRGLNAHAELTGFYTTSYSARLYGYERGLLYASNYRSYYGQGLRAMLMAGCTFLDGSLVCSAKIGCTFFFDRSSIGTYAELIPQSHAEDLALQLRYKFSARRH